jgi:hypothetical protein
MNAGPAPPLRWAPQSFPLTKDFLTLQLDTPKLHQMAQKQQPALTGNYTHLSNLTDNAAHSFQHPLPSLPENASTDDRTAFLNALRENVAALQDEVNVFLTAKMEEDKSREGGDTAAGKKVDEEKEEQNYGEEVMEDD